MSKQTPSGSLLTAYDRYFASAKVPAIAVASTDGFEVVQPTPSNKVEAPSKEEPKDTKSCWAPGLNVGVPLCPTLSASDMKVFVRTHLLNTKRIHLGTKMGKAAKGMGGYQVVHGTLTTVRVIAPAVTTGAYNDLLGWANLITSFDYSPFAGLFDIMRVNAVEVFYSAVNPGSGNTQSTAPVAGVPVHVPFLLSMRPDDFGTTSWNNASVSWDLTSEKNTQYVNTSMLKYHHRFETPSGKVITGTSTIDTSLGNWMNSTMGSGVVAGGVSLSILPNAWNGSGSVICGCYITSYDCQWAYRL
jgi:hypothetical protein